jgi:hypothetical protein
MYCSGCGNKIEGETNFCQKCGKELLNQGGKAGSAPMKTADRPVGLVLTVLYCVFSGIISLIGGIPLLSLSNQIPSLRVPSLLVLIFGVFYLAMSYGLWTSQGWGIPFSLKILYLSIPLNIISLLIPIPASYSGNKEGMIFLAGVEILLTLFIIQYLKSYAAKRQTQEEKK